MTTKITPDQIKDKRFWASKWQNDETEASAYWLCWFARVRGNWNDFTPKEINKFYNDERKKDKQKPEDFWFNYLTTYGDIIVHKEHVIEKCKPYTEGNVTYRTRSSEVVVRYSFTDSFVEECFRLSEKD